MKKKNVKRKSAAKPAKRNNNPKVKVSELLNPVRTVFEPVEIKERTRARKIVKDLDRDKIVKNIKMEVQAAADHIEQRTKFFEDHAPKKEVAKKKRSK